MYFVTKHQVSSVSRLPLSMCTLVRFRQVGSNYDRVKSKLVSLSILGSPEPVNDGSGNDIFLY